MPLKPLLIAALALSLALPVISAHAQTSASAPQVIPPFRSFACTPDDLSRLNTTVEHFKKVWGAQDTSAVIAMHAPDTEWINAYGRQFQDAAELGKFLQTRLFPMFETSVSEREAAGIRPISYRCLGQTAAVIHLYTEGPRGPSRIAGETLRRTHMHFVLENRADGWQIVHTAIMDVR
ncbi:nuclear transport factor 2 family protein [Asticcacaulis machinosus]|uniref:Nuclear transport factor 2 family protein n=1 Tax=Asticcacaulis machinosus TaxID=2984211 RepID=A0ABT5HLX0_9CAUL|nr:nuclear transport factor 2 family protein [Asticcacaulis machinosus]MDC7677235.1 nuclear transport factor 2 family protein [Asticcacaulis machinosus]